ISVWSGSCGNLTCIGGNDDGTGCSGFTSEFTFQSLAGEDYFILVHGFGSATGDFNLSLTCAPACTPVPANDNCSDATPLVSSFTCTPQTFTNTCANPAAFNPSCDPFGNIYDVWFSFNTGSFENHLAIFNLGTATVLSAALYDSCGGNEILCETGIFNDTVILSNLDTQTTYLLQVWNGGGVQAGTFDLCLVPAPPAPANDLCTGAIPVTCNSMVTGNTQFATTADNPASDCGVSITSPALWYVFTGTGDAVTLSTCSPNTDFDTKIHVFTGSCGALTCFNANDDDFNCPTDIFQSTVTFNSVFGVNYYILVSGFGSETGNFELSVSCSQVPPNDACANAITIGCDTTISGSTVGANIDVAPVCQPDITSPGVWYHFPGNGDFITVSTCDQASFDTKITVYSGACGSLTCVGGNDDGSGCSGFTSEFAFQSQAGVDYYILVHGFGSATGTFDLTLSCAPPCVPVPSNDDCANAVTLTPIATCTGATNYTNECAALATANPSCDPFGNIQDVWFTFNSGPDTSLNLVFTLGTATSLSVALYDGCGGTELGCLTGLGNDTVFMTGLTPNTNYWVQVWNGGGGDEGTFGVCLTYPPPPPGNDDKCAVDPGMFELIVDAPMMVFDNTSATPDGPAGPCWFGADPVDHDVWFYFTAPPSGAVIVETFDVGEMDDSQIAIYEVTGCPSTPSFTLLGCDDDGGDGLMSRDTITGLNPGQGYCIQVDG
ncbi:MAG: hypothetical protein D6706_00255, partial [Chloroflexi bacterium]